MAITPTQAKELLPDDRAMIQEMEKHIDAAIHSAYRKAEYRINLSPSIFPNARVRQACAEIYRKAGWNWEEFEDQRERESWITISPANNAHG